MFSYSRFKELTTSAGNVKKKYNSHLVSKVSTFIEVDSLE